MIDVLIDIRNAAIAVLFGWMYFNLKNRRKRTAIFAIIAVMIINMYIIALQIMAGL